MKYPRIDPRLDHRRKLMPGDYSKIRALYRKIRNMSALARRFGVACVTIKRIVDPAEGERLNEKKKLWNKNHRSDPEYKRKKNLQWAEHKRRRSLDPIWRKYNAEYADLFRKRRKKMLTKTTK